MTTPKWLEWAQGLQALAQAGLTYSRNPFDHDRYRAIRNIAAEVVATYSETDLAIVQGLYDAQAGYTTPKIDSRGVIFMDNKVLLVKELIDGKWTLPGGWVDVNESPSAAVEREVREETGYEVKARKLLALYDRSKHGHPPYIFHAYKIFFLCDFIGGEGTTSIETGGSNWFGEDELPPLSIERTTEEEIHRFFEHLRHPYWPTDFD